MLFTVFKQFDRGASSAGQIGYSDFLEEVRSKRIKSVPAQEGAAAAPRSVHAPPTTRTAHRPRRTSIAGLVGDLINNGIKFDVKPREEPSFLLSLLASWGPILLLIGVWIYFMRQMQGRRQGRAFSFGKSKARMA